MSARPKALVITAPGINCDGEQPRQHYQGDQRQQREQIGLPGDGQVVPG